MTKSKVQEAISSAEASKQSAVMVSGIQSGPKVLRLCTKLGKHSWQWGVHAHDTFGKLKGKFAEVYGIAPAEIIFVFDGDLIRDESTFIDLEMEDDFLIDVRVPKDKEASAIMTADAFKSSKRGA